MVSAKRWRGRWAGKALCVSNGRVMLNNRSLSVAKLLFTYITGYVPKSKVYHVDGNPNNIRWDNLTLVNPHRTFKANRMVKVWFTHSCVDIGVFSTVELAKAAYVEAITDLTFNGRI